MTGEVHTGERSVLRTIAVVTVLLGLTVQAGAAQVSLQQGASVDSTAGSSVAVETTWADPINESSVVVAGNLTALAANESADVWFEYRQKGTASWHSSTIETVETVGPFREVLTGLESGATYEYRARAADGSAAINGTISTVTVPDNPPTVKAEPAASVTESSARLSANVGWLGNADSAEVFFVVSPVGSDETIRTASETITQDGTVTQTVQQLRPNTSYEFVAHVHASDGDNATASPLQFTTDTEFAVRTGVAGAVNETAVKVTGWVSDFGGADSADVGVEYRRQDASQWTQAGWTTVTSSATVSETITGLSSETTYEVRVVGAAIDNDQDTGQTLTVTTESDPAPSVSTTGPADVSETFVGMTASVTDLGGAESVDVTFELRQSGASEWRTVAARTISEPRDVRADYFDLQSNTTYEYRAVAAGSDGDNATGAPVQFTTDTEFAVRTDGALARNATAVGVTGQITDFGGAESASAFVQYRLAGASNWTRTNETRATLSSAGSIEGVVTGLAPETTYEVRIRAVGTDEDQDFGQAVTVTTDSDAAPAVAATGVSDVTEHSARMAGTVTDLGGADSAEAAFQLRRPDSNEWFTFETRTVRGPADLNATFRDFQANSTYDYRVVVNASDGDIATSDSVAFTTDEAVSVTTDAASAVNSSAIVANGSVEHFGESADVSVEYRKPGSYTWTVGAQTSVSSAGTFEGVVTGLDPGTTYEVRVRAVASDGYEGYGAVHNVTTGDDPDPIASTTGATNVTEDSARLTASVTDLGGADGATVTVSLRNVETGERSTVATRTISGPADVSVLAEGLSADTTYAYHVVVEATDGDVVETGSERFTTETALAVTTDSTSVVNESAVTVSGTLADLGGADTATVAVEYRQAGTSEWVTAEQSTLASPGDVTATVDGLGSGTTYEVRLTATASDGDADAGDALTATTETAASAPAVDSFSTDQAHSPNPHLEFSADWSVSDADSDLDTVTVDVIDSDGTVVRSTTSSVGGGSATGSDSFKLKHVRNQEFTVKLTVTDESGRTTTETRTVTE